MNVYIVDDDRSVISSLEFALEKQFEGKDFKVFPIDDVLDLPLCSMETPPDIIVLDIMFKSGLNSFMAFKTLARKNLKVLLYTGMEFSEFEEECKSRGEDIPQNFEFFEKGDFSIVKRIKELSKDMNCSLI